MMTEPQPTPKLKNNNKSYEISGWEDENLALKPKLIRGIYSMGFEIPSSIQKKALYPMIHNINNNRHRDIIAQAQSGTGKTGAFSVGALQLIDETSDDTQALIIAPTHELADQTVKVIKQLGHYLKIRSMLLVGGTSVDKNKSDLHEIKPHVVVGTPGRIHDMIRRRYLKVDKIKILVIDEADEMMSSGFKDQMYNIFQPLHNDIQVALFSATYSEELEELSKSFMQNPTQIRVKAEELTLQGIAQYYINLMDDVQKYETVKDIFESLTISQAIIYCNSTHRVDDLAEAMKTDNFPVEKIHGKMSEQERKDNYTKFKKGACRVLITSDLFARGIDVQQVSIVINFDIPKNEHTYLHRIGRSGRWGRKGIAINFQTKQDSDKLKRFSDYYHTEIAEMPADFTEHLKST
jgi:translation initiation factor 4A|tara:strand:+ start:9688 stop:10908 length:1221 start_codon:yes stop_codon:yes gene_type:complete